MERTDYLKFNPEGSDLRKLQLRELEMMCEIDRVCRKYSIPYWLSSGTALGAVRHGGFIPWDDDLDIEVLRKDYKRLLKLLEKDLPETMLVQTTTTDKYYIQQYAKIRDLTTEVTERDVTANKYTYKGVFVDIFPMERVPKGIKRFSSKLYGQIFRLASYSKAYSYGLMRFYLFVLEKIIFPFLRLFSFLAPSDILQYSLGVGFLKERNKADIFPLKEMNFEGKQFFVPNNINEYLSQHFGNYMTFPPLESIEQHITSVKFDK
ncbi:LicD family protein [Parabacteroides sp. OttesenSCG-928-G07]|nr:LicD family protein [Parabacteroides sp. OttesenSCG-928-G07]